MRLTNFLSNNCIKLQAGFSFHRYMKLNLWVLPVFILSIILSSCNGGKGIPELRIIYLHHSTGRVIWNGGSSKEGKTNLQRLFREYNKENGRSYSIEEMTFPKAEPYGWKNYPFDYYNIWVKNGGDQLYKDELTLEILTKEYQVIIFKHCFPVSNIEEDDEAADIDSEKKTVSNYKLQYLALRDKLHSFPETKFILFTGAALTESAVTESAASRARNFFDWVRNEWDQTGDNIFLWDIYELETEGDLYMQNKYAISPGDSHPNKLFAANAVRLLFNRIIDVIENNGYNTSLTGSMGP